MLEASALRTRRALTTYRTTLAADFAFCLLTLALGCQGQILGTSPSPGGSHSKAGSPTTTIGGSAPTSTPVDVSNLVGLEEHAAGVLTASWNGDTELPELKA